MRDLAELTAADFEPHIGTSFEVIGTVPVVLRLVEAREGLGRPGMRTPFSLLFSGHDDRVLGGGIHGLRHPEVGELELYLNPVTVVGWPADAGTAYEAVFN